METESPKPKRPQSNAFMRYSGMATQMGITIALGVWGGMKLDEKFSGGGKGFTLTLSLVSVIVAMYMAIKDLMKK